MLNVKNEVLLNEESESRSANSGIQEVKNLRNVFNTTIEVSNRSTIALGDTMKLMDIGEIDTLVASSLAQLNMSNNSKTENKWVTRFRNIIPFGVMEKAEENVRMGLNKSKSINLIAKEINDSLTEKRDSVESMVDSLFELYGNIDTSYYQIKGVKDSLQEKIETNFFSGSDMFHAKILLTEILEYQKIQQTNLTMARDTIESVQVSVQQIAAMQPKLRAQMNDGLLMRGIIEDLNKLTTTCSVIEGLCETLQSENLEKISEAQMVAIENYTVSKESIKLLETNTKRQQELSLAISNKRKEMVQSVESKTSILEDLVKSDHENRISGMKKEVGRLSALQNTTFVGD